MPLVPGPFMIFCICWQYTWIQFIIVIWKIWICEQRAGVGQYLKEFSKLEFDGQPEREIEDRIVSIWWHLKVDLWVIFPMIFSLPHRENRLFRSNTNENFVQYLLTYFPCDPWSSIACLGWTVQFIWWPLDVIARWFYIIRPITFRTRPFHNLLVSFKNNSI